MTVKIAASGMTMVSESSIQDHMRIELHKGYFCISPNEI